MDGYVTIAEVAREYRVSRSHVRNMCADGRLDADWVGGVWRIPRTSLRVFKSRTGGAAGVARSGRGESRVVV
jgi:excisionase family DNA binding protein